MQTITPTERHNLVVATKIAAAFNEGYKLTQHILTRMEQISNQTQLPAMLASPITPHIKLPHNHCLFPVSGTPEWEITGPNLNTLQTVRAILVETANQVLPAPATVA